MSAARRPYHQIARAAASQDLRQRIVAASHEMLLARWIDEITLDDVALAAGTTRRTVIRLFGGKEGLLEAVVALIQSTILIRRAAPPGAPPRVVAEALVRNYEAEGDIIARLLAQEERHPALRPLLDTGRAGHRAWVAETFGPRLAKLSGPKREHLITRLVVVLDVYVWKLLRRDLHHDVAEVVDLLAEMLSIVLGENAP